MMKVYDKEIYKKQESISVTVILVLAFLLGFFTGYIANSFNSNKEGSTLKSNNINTVKNV